MIKHHVTSKQSQHSSGQNDFLPESSVFPHLILVLVCLLEHFSCFFHCLTSCRKYYISVLIPLKLLLSHALAYLFLSTEHILLYEE